MKSIWIANYDGNEIKIVNTWFNGERLFVNGKLQDDRFSLFSADLVGHVRTKDDEKKMIKVNIGGWLKITCRLFVDDEQVAIVQQR